MGQLSGKTAIVTGASRGIGAAIARRFAAEGAKVAITARTLDKHDHLPGSLNETLAAIRADGNEAIAIAADLTSEAERARIVRETQQQLGKVDILVNNAAANFFIPFEQISEKRFHIMHQMNCRAPFHMAQLVLPDMRELGRGWVLNISSATAGHPHGPPYPEHDLHNHPMLYGMSKAALDRFTTGLAAELFEADIAVNSLSPVAAVATPGTLALGVVGDPSLYEGEEIMAEAALALCTAAPKQRTGRIAFSGTLLKELGITARTLDGRAEYDGSIPALNT